MNTDNQSNQLITKKAHEYFEEPHTCPFCHTVFTGWGNNPEPLSYYENRCCNACNNELVIPWRVKHGRHTPPYFMRWGFGKTKEASIGHFVHTAPVDPNPPDYEAMAKFVQDLVEQRDKYDIPAFGPLDDLDRHGIIEGSPADYMNVLGGADGQVWYGRKPDEDDEIGQAVHDALSKSMLTGHHNTGVITQ